MYISNCEMDCNSKYAGSSKENIFMYTCQYKSIEIEINTALHGPVA